MYVCIYAICTPRAWFLAQIDAYEYGFNGIGWFFWNMKIEQGELRNEYMDHRIRTARKVMGWS